MYHIVIFEETNEVGVVPTLWVKDGVCLWPPYKDEDIVKATKSQEYPGEAWNPYSVRVIFSAGSYAEARLKLPEAEVHTDLQTDAEEHLVKAKRKRIKSCRRFPGESEDENPRSVQKINLPNAPKISKISKMNHASASKIIKPLQSRKYASSGPSDYKRHASTQTHVSTRHASPGPVSTRHTSPGPVSTRHTSPGPVSTRHTSPGPVSTRHASHEPVSTRHTSSEPVSTRHASPRPSHSLRHTSPLLSRANSPEPTLLAYPELLDFRRAESRPFNTSKSLDLSRASAESPDCPPSPVCGCQHTTSQTTEVNNSLLLNLLANQEIILEQLRIISKTIQVQRGRRVMQDDLPEGLFPLGSVQELEDIDEELKVNRELRQKMIDYLSLKGGCDVKESVWRILGHIISHDLSKTMNWRGINGKVPFYNLQLREIVNNAVRRNHLTQSAMDQEVENCVKRWLQLAGDRNGGRKERKYRIKRENNV